MARIRTKLMHAAFNAFQSPKQDVVSYNDYSGSYGTRPDQVRLRFSNERSIISAIVTRLALDVSSNTIRHVRLDDDDRYEETIKSGLNNCLTVEANMDQAAGQFKRDLVMTILDKGVAAVVPVTTTINPETSGSYDIITMRVGEIETWYPKYVKVQVWNEDRGIRQPLILPKTSVAIVENPLYAVMNEPNSTLQRLIRKLNLLDSIDEQSASGKLDLMIQLPYVIKSEMRKQQAAQRRAEIDSQLKDSKYGIAYIDGAEKVIQLNRPAENNLMGQIEYLTKLLYSQLGLTEEVMNGTADEKTMLNYENRTIEPLLTAITEAMTRTFLTKTARTQGQSIAFYKDPFKLVPISQIADIADKFARNEIASANDLRSAIGWKPSTDPKADQLVNSNMPAPSGQAPSQPMEGDSQNGS